MDVANWPGVRVRNADEALLVERGIRARDYRTTPRWRLLRRYRLGRSLGYRRLLILAPWVVWLRQDWQKWQTAKGYGESWRTFRRFQKQHRPTQHARNRKVAP